MFFSTAHSLLRVLVVGTCGYVALVALLRLSGKRTLSKMNAFDLVVTVALGSTLASMLLQKSVALADGVLAIAVLIGLQYAISWTSVRSRRFSALVKAEPTVILERGRYLEHELRRARVTREEVDAAVRQAHVGDPARVEKVVLETDGSLTVVMPSPRSSTPERPQRPDMDSLDSAAT